MEDEDIQKQQELNSSTKAVRTAGRIAANYYTGGTYEKLRNAPGIGKTVRKLEDKTANAVTNGAMKGNINAKDVEAIKNRKGINEAMPFKNRGEDTEDVGSSLDKKDSLDSESGLDDKKGLNGKEGLSKKEKNSKSDNSSIDISEEKGKAEGKGDSLFDSINPFAKFKRLKRKVKIYIILAGIVLAFGLLFLIILSAMMAVDTFVSSITNFFGISEQDVDDGNSTIEGLYTDDQYLFDENGNPLTGEELVNNLKSNETCKITFWNSIGDFFRGNSINDYCYLMRTIQRETKDNNMDKALVIATLVYGFDSQPKDTQYFDNEDIPSDNVSASEHYESLIKALQGNDKINKDTIKKIVDNSVVHKPVYYYTWTIDYNENSNSVAKVGKCVRGTYSDGQYDINKWKVFMRFGEEVADKYDQYVNASKVYEMSSEECRGEVSTSELLQRVNESNDGNGVGRLDSSVSEAINYLREFTTSSLEPFNQHADVDSKTKDQFTSYNGIIFDYRNGFAFNYYPGFKDAMSDNVTNIEYDDIFTPKEIETILDEIQDRKIEMNEILMFPDQDSDDYYYGADRSSSVITGVNCKPFLTAGLEDIRVNLTDCYGTHLGQVSFEDYIIGVANAEVSDRNEDYVLSEMVAAISYSLARRGNYKKGNVITMKSGTCDQAYCNPNKGCTVKNTPVGSCKICTSFYIGGGRGRVKGLYEKYQGYYAKAANFLVVKNGKVKSTGYVSTVQKEWYKKASNGMSFTQIIQETYPDAEVIQCSGDDLKSNTTDSSSTVPKAEISTTKYGNKATNEYPNVSADRGAYYGFAYSNGSDGSHISINPEWKQNNLVTVTPRCNGSNEFSNMKFTINKKAMSNYEKAFSNICKIITSGVKLTDGTTCKIPANYLMDGEVFLEKKSSGGDIDLHAYGLAQDWNYSARYTINGVSYRPYSTRNVEDYIKFINAIGGEEKCSNINYILYKYAYKDAGFEWGGNFGRNGNSGSFDGKLFQIKY